MPDDEEHLVMMNEKGPKVDGKGTYQLHKYKRSLDFVDNFRNAIDIGAHIGQWTMQMAKDFNHVIAFEPLELHFSCFEKNLEGCSNVTLHGMGLSNEAHWADFHSGTPNSHGDTWVVEDGPGQYNLETLDSFELTEVDFIKVDCEGYELFILQGGEQLLLANKPTVIVEQKKGMAAKYGLEDREAVDYLRGLGATLRDALQGDYILSWD